MRRMIWILLITLLTGCRTFEIGVVQTPTSAAAPTLRATTTPPTATALTRAASSIQTPTTSPTPTATIAPIVTMTPTCTASPIPASTPGLAKYYWPASLPANFTIQPCFSAVDEQGF